MLIGNTSISHSENVVFLKPRIFAGLVLQPASEAEENEVRGSREHPLAATLLPHKKSKFSISRTAIGTGEINYHNVRFKYSISSSCLSCILSEKKCFFVEKIRVGHFERGPILLYTIHICGLNRKLLIPAGAYVTYFPTVCVPSAPPLLCDIHLK